MCACNFDCLCFWSCVQQLTHAAAAAASSSSTTVEAAAVISDVVPVHREDIHSRLRIRRRISHTCRRPSRRRWACTRICRRRFAPGTSPSQSCCRRQRSGEASSHPCRRRWRHSCAYNNGGGGGVLEAVLDVWFQLHVLVYFLWDLWQNLLFLQLISPLFNQLMMMK